MRVIAGKYRSQPLAPPKGWKTRPTSDRMRETLFNVLAPRMEGAVFADLFAGTGAAGIEALSRGARQAYFAENAAPTLATLRDNLRRLGISTEAQVEPAGTLPLLRRLLKQGSRLDIVFLDPPYSDQAAYRATLEFLSSNALVTPGGVVVAEHSRRAAPEKPAGTLQPYRVIEQGEAALTFFAA